MALDIMDSFVKTAQKIAIQRVDSEMPGLPQAERAIMVQKELELIFAAMLKDAITKLDLRG